MHFASSVLCPVAIISLLKKAWSSDIHERPSMASIVDELMNIIAAKDNIEGGTGIPGQVE